MVELHLHGCRLVSLPYSISTINFTLLSVLDLSSNNFNSFIPPWLSNVSWLSSINLCSSSLRGAISDGMDHLANLRSLDLSFNIDIVGKIPSSFSNLCNLQTLHHLQVTNISGEITEFVDGLSQCSNSSLQTLDLSESSVWGSMPNSIGNLSSLQALRCPSRHYRPESTAPAVPRFLRLRHSHRFLSCLTKSCISVPRFPRRKSPSLHRSDATLPFSRLK
jgi:Leucine-rich repeat (LRR) protein